MSIFRRRPKAEHRYSFDEWVNDYFTYNGTTYPVTPNQTLRGTSEPIPGSFPGRAGAYMRNGVVFACLDVRLKLFSEARFQFQQMIGGRPGDLFGTTELSRLETPWPGGTTGDLLARIEQDGSLAGNAFIHRLPDRLERLRPDWVTIVVGSRAESGVGMWDIGSEVVGYVYQPGGPAGGKDPVVLFPDEVAHFAPIPDPLSPWRGMSWLQPIVTEIMGDSAATAHKEAFFTNGATVNTAIVMDPAVSKDLFEYFREAFEKGHVGAANAYKTLFLGGGADIKTIGSNMQQIEFKATQGAGETRIAAAAGVPPVIVGLSEGLQAATYSNYGQARRRFADGTMRPLWRNVAGSLSRIVNVPAGSRLWYDARDIAFLAEDEKDAADIRSVQAQSIKALTDAGFDADTVVKAVSSGDLTLLKHSGLFSVQLQPPMPDQPAPSANGNGNGVTPAMLP